MATNHYNQVQNGFPIPILHHMQNGLGIQTQTLTPLAAHPPIDDDSDDERSETNREQIKGDKMIRFTIHCPIAIKGDNNLVALDPSDQAQRLAREVITTIKDISHGQDGIPMIDQDGGPVPIDVSIHAELTIDGAKNVVGEKAVLGSMNNLSRRKAEEAKVVKEVPAQSRIKREREDGELDQVDSKRLRNE